MEPPAAPPPLAPDAATVAVALSFGAAMPVVVLTKLSSSIDDIAWATPFLTTKSRKQNLVRGVQYLITMLGVASSACVLAMGARALMESLLSDLGDWWSAERILGYTGATALGLYALYLFRSWWMERQEAQEEAKGTTQVSPSKKKDDTALPASIALESTAASSEQPHPVAEVEPASEGEPSPRSIEEHAGSAGSEVILTFDDEEPNETISGAASRNCSTLRKRLRPPELVIVAIFGSFDDLAVSTSLVLGGTIPVHALLLGVLLGSCIIVMICTAANLVRPLVNLLAKIPLWSIVGAFSIYTAVESST